MSVRIEVIGRIRILRGRDDLTQTLARGQIRLLAYLATRESPVSRKQVCRDLWPEERDFGVTGNRLRVSLSRLRAYFPSALIELKDRIQLDRDEVEVDSLEVKRALRASRDFVGADQELDAAWPWLPSLESSVLQDLEDDWALEAAADWKRFSGQQVIHMANLAHQLGDFGRSRTAASLGTRLQPDSEQAWTIYLESSAHLQAGVSALADWRTFLQSNPLVSSELREHLAPLLKSIKSGEFPAQANTETLSSGERSLVADMLERLVALRPALAREILAAPDVLPLAAKDPRVMSRLLDRVIHEAEVKDETWARCAARAIGCRAWINDSEGVLELAPQVLAATDHPLIRRAVFNAVSVAKSLRRDWKGAMDAINEAIEIAKGLPDPIERLSGEGNRASFLWLQGQYDAAIAAYDDCASQLREISGDRALAELTVCLGNRAFVPVMRGDFETGLAWSEEAYSFRRSNGLGIHGELTVPCLAMLRIIHGERESGVELLREGLVAVYQSDSARSQQIGLEFAAGALVALGDRRSAEGLIDWVNEWRLSTGLLRAPAEDHLMQSLLALPHEQALSLERITFTDTDSPRDVAHRVMRQLRILCQKA